MRRGSVSTWENFGRRSSANMAQFSGSPVQFMTMDDIKYKRTDGCFLSYKKAVIFLPIFILALIAAGFIGWYSHSTPKKQVQDVLNLSDEDTMKEQNTSNLVSSFVHPLKYWLYLKPTIIDCQSAAFEGRVVIEFRIDAPDRLNKLFLNAVNINVKQYELSLLKDLDKMSKESRKRGGAVVTENDSNDTSINITTVINETTEDYQLGNESKVTSNDTLFNMTEDWFLKHGIGKKEEIIEIKEYVIHKMKKHHVIYPKKVLKNGIYLLMIDYGVLSDDIVATNLDNYVGKWMVGTLLEPLEAPRVFPFFNGIHHRAIFSLSVERPKEVRVLSNMPLRSTKNAAANWVIDTFDDTPVISPYNLAFVIGDLKIVNRMTIISHNVTTTFWAGSETITLSTEKLYLLDKMEPIVLGLSNAFSLPYTLPKLDVVALPPSVISESGNFGLISIRKIMFSTITQTALVRKTEALKSLISLLGEHWLDGTDCMKSMADTWILDGSLVYLQDQLINEIDPSLQLAHSFVADVQTIAMEDDGYSISRMSEVKTIPFHMDWSKKRDVRGACLIRMLHGITNNDTAFRIAYEKLTRCQNGTIDVAEFLNSVNIATEELPEELSLKEVMDRWITQSGYPLVTVTRDYKDGSIIVKQKAFFYNKPTMEKDSLWHVPLTYVKHDENWSHPVKTWLKQEEGKIIYKDDGIDEEGNKTSWILFNVNKTGYYRVNYDETNWHLLATALDKNHEFFPPETRASLIDDVFALAAVGATRYETAFGFIKYMQMKERHYAPWSTFAHHVFKLNNLLYGTSAFLDFQMFLQQFVTPLYDQVTEDLVNGSPLTLLAIKLGCLSKYSKCLDLAKRNFILLKKDLAYKSTLPKYIYRTLYCTIAKHGGFEEWNYLSQKAMYTSEIDEKYDLLSSYGCFQSLEILHSILYELLRDNTYNEAEASVILKSFSINPNASRAAYKFIKHNWSDIFEKFSASHLTIESFILTMLNCVTTQSDLDDLHAFWENNYESIKTVKQVTALVETRANFASSFSKNYFNDIRGWLKKFNSTHGM